MSSPRWIQYPITHGYIWNFSVKRFEQTLFCHQSDSCNTKVCYQTRKNGENIPSTYLSSRLLTNVTNAVQILVKAHLNHFLSFKIFYQLRGKNSKCGADFNQSVINHILPPQWLRSFCFLNVLMLRFLQPNQVFLLKSNRV